MEEQALEREFEAYKQFSRQSLIKVMLRKYYRDLQGTGVQIPEFLLSVTPEQQADSDFNKLMAIGNPFIINALYETAYRILAPLGEI